MDETPETVQQQVPKECFWDVYEPMPPAYCGIATLHTHTQTYSAGTGTVNHICHVGTGFVLIELCVAHKLKKLQVPETR